MNSAYLQPVFLRLGRDNPVHTQVLDQLSVMIGDVPDGDNRDTEFGIRPAVTTLNAVERVLCRERGKHTVPVVEGIFQIFQKLAFAFRRIVSALLAVIGRLLAFELIEESNLRAGDVLYLLAKGACSAKISMRRDE